MFPTRGIRSFRSTRSHLFSGKVVDAVMNRTQSGTTCIIKTEPSRQAVTLVPGEYLAGSYPSINDLDSYSSSEARESTYRRSRDRLVYAPPL